ncbi:hypothetical protein PENSUB_2626 [Penicillium subrubescens]|jgi:hypothetical protein|uniref:Uncharacterized protein n=1 Tax=Penicillium subrubescens TaxID=1316194 RepID=A0A1Q5UGZ9_9EURO|nr:hypothetical protein PENSUB_2626 [Penicillium subrubescens]
MATRTSLARAIKRFFDLVLPLSMPSKGITRFKVLALVVMLNEGEGKNVNTFVEIHDHTWNIQEPVA